VRIKGSYTPQRRNTPVPSAAFAFCKHFAVGNWQASAVDCDDHLRRNSLREMWASNDTKYLVADATDHHPVPINGRLYDLKFGRNRLHHKARSRGRCTIILRNGRLSASAAFWTNQSNSDLVGHPGSMRQQRALPLLQFHSRYHIFVRLWAAVVSKLERVNSASRILEGLWVAGLGWAPEEYWLR
jgi:hypothetical protein